MFKLHSIAAFLLLSLAIHAQTTCTNLVQDSDFENHALNVWKPLLTGGAVNESTIFMSNSTQSGAYASLCRFINDKELNARQQSMTINNYTTYKLSFYYINIASSMSDPGFIKVGFYNYPTDLQIPVGTRIESYLKANKITYEIVSIPVTSATANQGILSSNIIKPKNSYNHMFFYATQEVNILDGISDFQVAIDNFTINPLISAGPDVEACYQTYTTLNAAYTSNWQWSTGATTQSTQAYASIITTTGPSGTSSSGAALKPASTSTPYTTYTLTATACDGNTYTDEVVVKAKLRPTVTITESGKNCSGSIITLTAKAVYPSTASSGTLMQGGVKIGPEATKEPPKDLTLQEFLWSSGRIGNKIVLTLPNNQTKLTYSATTLDKECPGTGYYNVYINPAPDLTIANTNPVLCINNSSTLLANSKTATQYKWSDGTTLANTTVRPTANATYTVTVYNKTGCSSSATTQVVVLPAFKSETVEVCNGATISLSASSGVAYKWSSSQTTQQISLIPTATSIYRVTVSNNILMGTTSRICQSVEEKRVQVNPLPNITFEQEPFSICGNKCATVTIKSETNTTYQWSNNKTGNSVDLCPIKTSEIFTVTATSNKKCTYETLAPLTTLPTPSVKLENDKATCPNNEVKLNIVEGGAPVYTWSTGEGNWGLSSINVKPTETTTYTVTVLIPQFQCTASDDIVISTTIAPPAINAGTDQTINAGQTISLQASGGIAYQWDNKQITSAISVTPTANTTYTVTGTGATGCTATDNIIVYVNPLPSACINSLTNGDFETFNATGVNSSSTISDFYSNYVPSWVPIEGAPQLINGNAVGFNGSNGYVHFTAFYGNKGSHSEKIRSTVTLIPNNRYRVSFYYRCQATQYADPYPSNPVIINLKNPIRLEFNGGYQSHHLPNTTTWTKFSYDITALSSSTLFTIYTYAHMPNTRHDFDIDNVSIVPLVDAGPNVTICKGNSATLTASNGTNYNWSNFASTATNTVSPSTTTTYTVTANNCFGETSTDQAIVLVQEPPLANAGQDITAEFGQTKQLVAGTGESYAWSNNETTSTILVTPTQTTTYTVTVSDNMKCTASDHVVVSINPIPTTCQNILANGDFETFDAAGVNASSGNDFSPITYISNWSGVGTPQLINGNGVGYNQTNAYTQLQFINSNGSNIRKDGIMALTNLTANIKYQLTFYYKTNSTVYSVPEPTSPVTVNTPTPLQIGIDGNTSTIQLNNTSQWTRYTMVFSTYKSGPGSVIEFTSLIPVLNTRHDFYIDNISIVPLANAGPDKTICPGQATTLTAADASSYSWNTGDKTQSITVSPASTTTYTVTGTNCFGATNSDLVVVYVFPSPAVNAGADKTIDLGTSTSLTATGGYTYTWSTQATTAITNVSPTLTTTYTVTGLSANQCSATDQVVISVNVIPTSCPNILSNGNFETFNSTLLDQARAIGNVEDFNPATKVPGWIKVMGNSQLYNKGNGYNGSAACFFSWSVLLNGTYHRQPIKQNVNTIAGEKYRITLVYKAQAMSYTNPPVNSNEKGNIELEFIANQPIRIPVNNGSDWQLFTYDYTATSSGSYFSICGVSTQENLRFDMSIDDISIVPLSNAGKDVSLCQGSTATTLTASTANSYLWNTGATTASININPSSTTTYSVTTINCYNETNTDNVIVTVNPKPTTTLSHNLFNTCPGEQVIITATNGDSYLWNTGDIYATIMPAPIYTTDYTVTITKGGCTASAMASVIMKEYLPELRTFSMRKVFDMGTVNAVTAISSTNTAWALYPDNLFKISYTAGGTYSASSSVLSFSNPAFDIKFVNGNIGFIFTKKEIYKTIDGGTTWLVIYQQTDNNTTIIDASVLGQSTLIILNNNATQSYISITTNGGTSWTNRNVPTLDNNSKIRFFNTSTGFLASPANLYRTQNGGLTWTSILNKTVSEMNILGSTSIVAVTHTGRYQSSNYFYTVDIFRSDDLGNTWSPGSPLFTDVQSYYPYYDDLSFSDNLNGYYGFPDGNRQLFKTHDGGFTWEPYQYDNFGWPNGFYFLNESFGLFVGQNNGGLWEMTSSDSNECPPYFVTQSGAKGENSGEDGPLQIDENVFYGMNSLGNNQPNPFFNETKIPYQLIKDADAYMIISDLTGRQIKSFKISAQANYVNIDLSDFESGMYMYSLQINGEIINTKKMTLVK